MTQTTSQWSAEAMRELGTHHAQVEADGDLEGTMATLVEVPVYEFWPAGRRATGREPVRRYYEHLISNFMPSQIGYALIEEWVSESSLAQEYSIEIHGESGPETHHVIGILWAADGLLGGERIWGDEAFLHKMVGPVWDDLEIIER